MHKPIIGLKKIRTNQALSEETHCYSADLWVDGELWGVVSNHGHGGADNFHGSNGRKYGDIADLDKLIGETYPPIDCADIGRPGETLTASLEIICGDLVNDHQSLKSMKAKFRANALFYEDGLPAPPSRKPLYQIKHQGDLTSCVARILAKWPAAVVLNTMPEAEALAAFRQAS